MPAGRPTKLTKQLQADFVEYITVGCSYKVTCEALNIGTTTFKRWMADGRDHDPAKRRYRAFRSAVKRAKHTLEVNCLKRIDLASMEPKHWTAAAWLLQNVVRGKYLKSAASIHKPEVDLTVADIAKELDEIRAHSNGELDRILAHSNSNGELDRIPAHSNGELDRIPAHSNGELDRIPAHSNGQCPVPSERIVGFDPESR